MRSLLVSMGRHKTLLIACTIVIILLILLVFILRNCACPAETINNSPTSSTTQTGQVLSTSETTPTNNPPVFNEISNKSVVAGNLLEFTIYASDPDGDPLIYSAPTRPAGAAFNNSTGLFSWLPVNGDVGNHPISFKVSDGKLEDILNINIHVTAPPVTSVPPTPTITLPTTATTLVNPFVLSDDFTSGTQWRTVFTSTDPGISHIATNSVEGGNDGGYLRMEHLMSVRGAISVYHYFSVTYDPAEGAIDHINYYEDHIEFLPPFTGAAIGWGFSLEQSGTRYNKSIGNAAYTNTSWQTASMLNLTATDFPGIDFSTSGKPITFGFYRSNTNNGAASYRTTHGIDNWKVEIFRK